MWAKHRVELWEAEEVLLGEHPVRRVRAGRYACDGRTGCGRTLRVIFEVSGSGRDVRAEVVTAFPV